MRVRNKRKDFWGVKGRGQPEALPRSLDGGGSGVGGAQGLLPCSQKGEAITSETDQTCGSVTLAEAKRQKCQEAMEPEAADGVSPWSGHSQPSGSLQGGKGRGRLV